MRELATQVRDFILVELQPRLAALDISIETVGGDFDLVSSGVLDSIGFIELIGAVEMRFQFEMDFENLDPAEFVIIDGFVQCAVESSRSKWA